MIGVNPATFRSVATLLLMISIITVSVPQRAQAVECTPPEVGDYTVSQSCSFPNSSNGNAIDGVYNGDMIIPDGTTLTVNAGQTICWYPGKSIQLAGGNIAINATGQLKECNVVQEMLANIGLDVYAAGQAARVYSNNLFVCQGEPCTASAPAGNGNLIVEGVLKMVGGSPGAGKVLTSDANGVASWQTAADGGGWTKSGSNVYLTTSTDRVGIGTTNPTVPLQVNNSQAIIQAVSSTDVFTSIIATNTPAGIDFRAGAGTDASSYGFAGTNSNHPFYIRVNSIPRMRITPTNVSIGNFEPAFALDVGNTICSRKALPNAVDSADSAAYLTYYASANNWSGFGAVSGSGLGPVGSIQFRTGTASDNFFTMTSGGRLGVGVVNPSSRLTISDNSNYTQSQGSLLVHQLDGTSGLGIVFIDTNSADSQMTTSSDFMRMRTSVGGTVDNEFRFRLNGTGIADGSWIGGGADVAEVYLIHGKGEPGDLVGIVPATQTNEPGKELRISQGKAYDSHVVGVISTFPGLLAAYGTDEEELTDENPRKPVALAGRVPVKVNLENGAIKAGDFLTSSSIPGVAMKATKSGKVIGQALEDYDGSVQLSQGVRIAEQDRLDAAWGGAVPKPPQGIGKIMLFVYPMWYAPEITEFEQRVIDLETKLNRRKE